MDCRVLTGPVRGGWNNSSILLSWVAALPLPARGAAAKADEEAFLALVRGSRRGLGNCGNAAL